METEKIHLPEPEAVTVDLAVQASSSLSDLADVDNDNFNPLEYTYKSADEKQYSFLRFNEFLANDHIFFTREKKPKNREKKELQPHTTNNRHSKSTNEQITLDHIL